MQHADAIDDAPITMLPHTGRTVLVVDIDGIIQGVACTGPLPQPGSDPGHESITRRVPAKVAPRLREAIELAFSTRAATSFAYSVERHDGTRRIVVDVAPLTLAGAAPRACVTLADAGADQPARAARDRAARAGQVEALARVTCGMAHDLNNILGGIIGYARLAARATAADRPERVPAYLEEIDNAGTRAAALLERVLIFARGAATQSATIDATAHVQSTFAKLEADSAGEVTLAFAADPEVGAVDIDATHLDAMLAELVANARAALGERGHVTLGITRRAATTVHCDACHRDAHGDWVVLSVADDGPGIASELLDGLFEPYSSARDGRAGLGLSVVHGLAHQHGGHLNVTTQAGVGTCIEILLPSRSASMAALPEVDSSDGHHQHVDSTLAAL